MSPRATRRSRSRAAARLIATLGLAIVSTAAAQDAEVVSISDPIVLSGLPDTGVDGNAAAKGRLLRLSYPLPDGYVSPLLAAYVDGVGPTVWDLEGGTEAAQDVFVTRSLDDGRNWSTPINLSSSANLSSIDSDHDGDPGTPPIPYAGDVEKPTLFANGKRVLVAWLSRYCPSGVQGTVRYPDAGGVEVPYACLWSSRSIDGGATWSPPSSMTDAFRDGKQESARGTGTGFAVTLQQDPRGLQPGEAEGHGEGASGAKVSRGTDIWFAALATSEFDTGAPFPPLERLTDNFTRFDSDGFESGAVGSSRASLHLDGKTALVAYEETKGLGQEIDEGKYVRYHVFSAFDASLPDVTAGRGCILSGPTENARRARLVGQPGPLQGSSTLRVFLFWRQGIEGHGAPADIMGRVGRVDPTDPSSTGRRSEDLWPPVGPDCDLRAGAFANASPLNLSSDRGLGAATSDNRREDARAHRAVVRGDSILMGWTRVPDWEAFRAPGRENYDFFVRRSPDGGATWSAPLNLSRIRTPWIDAAEPRLMGTPMSQDPSELQDATVAFAVWGTRTERMPEAGLPASDLDLFVTRTTDFGGTWEPVSVLAGGTPPQFESQVRSDGSGQHLYAVWQEEEPTGAVDTRFRTVTFRTLFADGFESGDTTRWAGSAP